MANRKLLIKIRSELLFQINERVLRNNEDRKVFNMRKKKQAEGLTFCLESHLQLPEVVSGSGEPTGGVKLCSLSLANPSGDCLGGHSK